MYNTVSFTLCFLVKTYWRGISEAFDSLKNPTTNGPHCEGTATIVHDSPGTKGKTNIQWGPLALTYTGMVRLNWLYRHQLYLWPRIPAEIVSISEIIVNCNNVIKGQKTNASIRFSFRQYAKMSAGCTGFCPLHVWAYYQFHANNIMLKQFRNVLLDFRYIINKDIFKVLRKKRWATHSMQSDSIPPSTYYV